MGLAMSEHDQTVGHQESGLFKESEAGLIPADWGAAYIEDIAAITTGSRNTQDRVKGGTYPFFVRSQNIERINSYSFAKEAVLTAGDGVGTGKIFHYIDGRFDVHQRVYVMSDFVEAISGYFFYLVFSSRFYDRIMQMTAKSSVDSVRREMIARMAIPLPPRREQDAIVEALQEADGLIVELELLIEKKRLIKQGAMQELLSGCRRLPGFRGEWASRRIDEIAEIRSGGTPSTIQSELWDGEVPWCTPTDITALSSAKYISQTARNISDVGLSKSSAELIPENSIVMTSRATIGECAINTVPLATNQGFKNLVPRRGVNAEFLYYLMGMQKQALIALCGGSTFLEIGKRQLAGFQVNLPREEAEQSAIGQTLAEMDKELDALDARLEKARQIKQGMTQQLLTGRVRLV